MQKYSFWIGGERYDIKDVGSVVKMLKTEGELEKMIAGIEGEWKLAKTLLALRERGLITIRAKNKTTTQCLEDLKGQIRDNEQFLKLLKSQSTT